jgi:hypothetical protein
MGWAHLPPLAPRRPKPKTGQNLYSLRTTVLPTFPPQFSNTYHLLLSPGKTHFFRFLRGGEPVSLIVLGHIC